LWILLALLPIVFCCIVIHASCKNNTPLPDRMWVRDDRTGKLTLINL